ncbi:MAG: AAA domain-containing protein [Bacteroidaceae bacterium]
MKEIIAQRRLLQMEYDAEKEAFRRETETKNVGHKVKRGKCWFPIKVGRHYFNSLNQLVVEIFRTENLEIDHCFEFGKPVSFFSEDGGGMITHFPFNATVSYVDEDRMVVAMPNVAAVASIENRGRVGVQLYFDETSYRLMFEALDHVIASPEGRWTELCHIFHGNAPLHTAPSLPVRFPWLNVTQEAAVNEVLRAKDVAVVHGPPGTGKTTTLVEAIYEVLRRESQVMVCAQSNMAVDWISEKLNDRGVAVLRIGNPTKVNDKMLSFTYERRFEAHPDYPQLWAIRRDLRQLYATPRSGRSDSFHQKIAHLRDHASEIERRIRESLFSEARVIACTLTSSANQILQNQQYDTLFIDEAAQALEAACWIAIRKAKRVILAGDHQQLPPTIKCIEAARQGLNRTLMQVVVENKPKAVSLLTMQYRMSDALMQFSSHWFYEGKMKSAPEVSHRGILDLDTPITWIDTPNESTDEATAFVHEELVGENDGKRNTAEAQLAVQTIKTYIERIGKQRMLDEGIDFGVISPYKAQVQLLRKKLSHEAWFKPFRRQFTINTVDGFQGQERDVILISMVRANEQGQIGFLSDLRRMNVAITRARMKLIIIGDIATLTRHRFYRELYEYVARGCSFE